MNNQTNNLPPDLPHDSNGFLTGGERLINGIDEVKLDTHAILAILKNLNNRQQQAQQSVRDSLKHIGQHVKKTVEAVNQTTATLSQKLGAIRPTIDSENLGQGQVNPVVVNPSPSNSSNDQGSSTVNADSDLRSNPPIVNSEQGAQNPLPSPSPSPSPSPMPNNGQNRQRDSNGRFSSGEDNKQGWWNKLKAMVRGGVQEANTDTHNIDPTVDAVRELGDALSPVVKVGKAMFKGAAWLFGRKKKQPPPSDQEQRQQTRIEKLLRRIADARARATGAAGQGLNLLGGIGGSLLGGLGSLLMRALIPALGLTAAFNFGQWIGGKIYEFIEPALTPLIDGIAAIPETISNAWQGVVDIASKGIETVVDSFKNVKDGVVNAYESTVQAATNGIENVANGAKGIWNWGKGVYNKAVDATSNGIEKGTKAASMAMESVKSGYQNVKKKGKQLVFDDVGAAMAFQGEKTIKGMNDSQTRALAATTMKTESGGDQNAVNSYGFSGQYQFGADALSGEGLINKEKLAAAKKAAGSNWYKGGMHKAFLADNANWTIEGGQQAFLADKKLQDNAFVSYTNKNVQAGFRSGALKEGDDPSKIAAYAKAAHLKGAGGANQLFLKGVDSKDAYGMSASKYAQDAANNLNVLSAKVDTEKKNGTVAATNTQTAKTVTPQSTPTIERFIATPLKIATTPTAIPQAATPKPVPVVAAKSVPEAPKVQQQVSTVKPKASGANARQEGISQNISDRLLAHAVTGGLGMLDRV